MCYAYPSHYLIMKIINICIQNNITYSLLNDNNMLLHIMQKEVEIIISKSLYIENSMQIYI